ncbi:MAG: peptidylprolyl isomerase [Bacteroidales bacterium]|nr:peptidylprolyl isomerase [Bacteroidales bacterium]
MKRNLILTVFVLLSFFAYSQKDSIVLEIGNEKISKTEFLNMYNKNNTYSQAKDKQDLDSYLNLYINYKLKLLQAHELGLDTTSTYYSEVNDYRKQIVEPYINDRTITDSLVQEAYDRMSEFLRASHILINIPANATPKDTLAAYGKALMIRDRLLKGESFEDLAKEYSDDPSVKDIPAEENRPARVGNGGDLGYFTSMQMIYPFENACYSMKKGEISLPIRTSFGYHIVKLVDRIPADFSTCDLKHVLITTDNRTEEEAERIINEARSYVVPWGIDSVAKIYSDDKFSAQNAGWLMRQKCNTIPPEFILAMKNMKDGELSQPFKTRFGWHIFRLVKRYPIKSLEEERKNIEQRISKDQRAYRSIESFISKAKQEYGFKEYRNNILELSNVVTDSVFSGTWQIPEDFKGEKIIFSIGDSSYTQMDLVQELYTAQRKQTPTYLPDFIEGFAKDFEDNKSFEYADARLEDKHPDFRENMQSFREGILIFAITDKEVWNKSLVDTLGLQMYYDNHKAEYIWKERADVTNWTIDKSLKIKKIESLIKKYTKKGLTNDEILAQLLKKFSIKKTPSRYISYTWGKYEKVANKNVDKLIWNTPLSNDLNAKDVIITDTNLLTNKNTIMVLKQFIAPQQKTLDECKGVVTSQYQEYLEKKWIEELRSKYYYKVNYDVLNSIKQ